MKIKLLLLAMIIILSFFIDDNDTHGERSRWSISPFGSVYLLDYQKNDVDMKLSQKEKKFLKKEFKQNNRIYVNFNNLHSKSRKTMLSLIEKEIITKNHYSFHLLGTDHQGRDLLKMLIFATRINISLSLVAVIFSIIFGTMIGVFQGYVLNRAIPIYYQKLRSFFSFIINSITSIPMIVWLLVSVLITEFWLPFDKEFMKMTWIFILMGSFYYSMILSQTIEAHIISLKELEFLSSSELMGISRIKIIYSHIIKTNLGSLLFSQSLLIIIQTIMLEITISFKYIGLGFAAKVSFGYLVSTMFQPHSINMLIPIIYAGILCILLNTLANTYRKIHI